MQHTVCSVGLTFTIRPHLETSIFASYYRQQTMVLIYIWRQIQPEMQDLAVNEVYSLPVP